MSRHVKCCELTCAVCFEPVKTVRIQVKSNQRKEKMEGDPLFSKEPDPKYAQFVEKSPALQKQWPVVFGTEWELDECWPSAVVCKGKCWKSIRNAAKTETKMSKGPEKPAPTSSFNKHVQNHECDDYQCEVCKKFKPKDQ